MHLRSRFVRWCASDLCMYFTYTFMLSDSRGDGVSGGSGGAGEAAYFYDCEG